MAVRFNPELEMVDSDDDAGTMTIRNVKTGETVTLDYAEIEQGKFSWSTDEGTAEINVNTTGEEGEGVMTFRDSEGNTASFGATEVEVPEWLPLYPGARREQGVFSSSTGDGNMATFQLITADSPEEMIDFYTRELEAAGFEVQTQTYATGSAGTKGGLLSAENKAEKRTVVIALGTEGGETRAGIQFTEGK
jgi:hypothetical protein